MATVYGVAIESHACLNIQKIAVLWKSVDPVGITVSQLGVFICSHIQSDLCSINRRMQSVRRNRREYKEDSASLKLERE